MDDDSALAVIREAARAVAPDAADRITVDTDLVADGIFDSLDVMSFLFELEQALGRKLDAIAEDHDDFRVATLMRIVAAA